MELGDKVSYVPDLCHAFEQDATGVFTWKMGIKRESRKGRTTEFTVDPLTDEEVKVFKNRKGDLSRLSFISPNLIWTGTVTGINDDGSVNLDLPGSNAAVTLHYSNVKVDPSGTVPHTCHALIQAVAKTVVETTHYEND